MISPEMYKTFTKRVTQLDETSMTNWIINMSSSAISEKLKSTRNSTSRRYDHRRTE